MDDALTIATDIAIAAPPARVWQVLTAFPDHAHWNPYMVAIDGPFQPGATLAVRLQLDPTADPVASQAILVSARFPEMIWEGGHADRSIFRGDHRFRVEPEGNGTRFRHFEHFSGTAAVGMLAAHGAAIRANFERMNAALKAECERQ